MKPVEVRKNEVALDDTSAPVKISFEVDAEAKIIPAVVNARRLLSSNPGISSIQIDMPAKVYEFDDNDQEITSDSVFNYKIDVTRDTVYLEGVNSGYSASVVDVYMDELIEDMNEKIEKELTQLTSTSSLTGAVTSTSNNNIEAEIVHHLTRFTEDNENISAGTQYSQIMSIAKKMIDDRVITEFSEDIDELVQNNLSKYLAGEVGIKEIASAAPESASLKEAVASLPKTSNPTLKA
ncbi:MAG: hypothetical protein M1300_04060 [Epsilonproteobacteria bacterium]|nr:hypothetical protein [Campylobacterota bacterium]